LFIFAGLTQRWSVEQYSMDVEVSKCNVCIGIGPGIKESSVRDVKRHATQSRRNATRTDDLGLSTTFTFNIKENHPDCQKTAPANEIAIIIDSLHRKRNATDQQPSVRDSSDVKVQSYFKE
jgi:hypothetical protein